MFVSSTGRCASICRSTIGELDRASTKPQSRKHAADARTSPSSTGEVQPQSSPSVSATISATSAPESRSAPGHVDP